MKTIPLTQGQYALVNDDDCEILSEYKWHAVKIGNTFYASRARPGDYKRIWMQQWHVLKQNASYLETIPESWTISS